MQAQAVHEKSCSFADYTKAAINTNRI